MSKQSINLMIAGKSYPFTIERDKEEIYRLAEREVNNHFADFQKHHIKDFTPQDYLALTALKFAIADVSSRKEREIESDDVKSLKALSGMIDERLNSLDKK